MKYTQTNIIFNLNEPIDIELGKLETGDCFYYKADPDKRVHLLVEIHSEQVRCICLNDGKLWLTHNLEQMVTPINIQIHPTPIYAN